MTRICGLCKDEFEINDVRQHARKFCESCIPKSRKIAQKTAYDNFQERKRNGIILVKPVNKKRYASQTVSQKKPQNESNRREDQKSFWKDRDTSCDGCAYF